SGDECPPEVLGAESSVVTTWRKLDIVHYAMEAPPGNHLWPPPTSIPDLSYNCKKPQYGDCRLISSFSESGHLFSLNGFLDDCYVWAPAIEQNLGKPFRHFVTYDFHITGDPDPLGFLTYAMPLMQDYDSDSSTEAYIWGVDIIKDDFDAYMGVTSAQGHPISVLSVPFIKYRVDVSDRWYPGLNTYDYALLKTLCHETTHLLQYDPFERTTWCPEEDSVENDIMRQGLPWHDIYLDNGVKDGIYDCGVKIPLWVSYDRMKYSRMPTASRYH
ncbi:MAG: hypothetical protein HRF49_08145, partial [bacterium]